jgi:hypothetical protein
MKRRVAGFALGLTVLAFAVHAASADRGARDDKETKKVEPRVFEMRTYYAETGKMTALHARFREHTCKLLFTIARVIPTMTVRRDNRDETCILFDSIQFVEAGQG